MSSISEVLSSKKTIFQNEICPKADSDRSENFKKSSQLLTERWPHHSSKKMIPKARIC
jgi:hypothetical protein